MTIKRRDMTQEEIELEEILLGYLRDSDKVKLSKLNVMRDNNQKSYQILITFDVNGNFPGNLNYPLNNTLGKREND